MAVGAPGAAEPVPDAALRSVTVRTTADGYAADLVLWVPAPPELAFGVMVDFEHMPLWAPNLRESRVLTRDERRVRVEHRGVVSLGALSLTFRTVRDIEFEAPRWTHTVEVEGNMRRHESRMDFVAEGSGTRIDYHVEMVPGGLAAVLMTERRVEAELREQLLAIGAEIVRRRRAEIPAPR